MEKDKRESLGVPSEGELRLALVSTEFRAASYRRSEAFHIDRAKDFGELAEDAEAERMQIEAQLAELRAAEIIDE